MHSSTNVAVHSINKTLVAFTIAIVLSFVALTVVHTQSTSAYWANKREFSYAAINSWCKFTLSGTIYYRTAYAANWKNNVSEWYCMKNSSMGSWIRPGDVCKFNYGSAAPSFVTTNYYWAYGGYCAVWR